MPFTCPDCGRTSSHPHDEQNQYCGNCHQFKTPEDIRLRRLLWLYTPEAREWLDQVETGGHQREDPPHGEQPHQREEG